MKGGTLHRSGSIGGWALEGQTWQAQKTCQLSTASRETGSEMSEITVTEWLLQSNEPWTRYRTLVDLLDRPEGDAEVQAAGAAMVAHAQVQVLVAEVAAWPGYAIRRHNDAGHPLHKLSMLADFGLRAAPPETCPPRAGVTPSGRGTGDPGLTAAVEAVLAHQSAEGVFQSLISIPKAFGGDDHDHWAWVLCDAPILAHALLAMGLGDDPRVARAVDHLAGLVDENGWRCVAAPELGRFRGPGRKTDPCPIANVYALKALARAPGRLDSPAARIGVEMLLRHWELRAEIKPYLFGAGTDYSKLKYPFVWYDILHVVDVLSRFPFAHGDPRLGEMAAAIAAQADGQGRYTARSIYQAWKGWSFADKKNPSPWLTFLVVRALKRMGR